MSILASLANAYDRLPDAPPFGYSRIEAAFCIVLREDGHLAFDPIDLRIPDKRRMVGPTKNLPSPLAQRTSGIKPNFLWDKTAYSLGITDKPTERTTDEHAAFVSFHQKVLGSSSDAGLRAFKNFVEWWRPEPFGEAPWVEGIKDQNVIFALEGSYRSEFLHERPAARELWEKLLNEEPGIEAQCLVTGTWDRIALSHPPIKKVENAQSSGAFIVSFNDEAYRSYGHTSGDNAPVSERVAFKYTTALNLFLERDSGHRVQIGDASTVFWADSSNIEAAAEAEVWGAYMLDAPSMNINDDQAASKEVGIKLDLIRNGEHLDQIEPNLAKGVQFYVLALAPNAARLSVRFYYQSSFSDLTSNYIAYLNDIEFHPWPNNRRMPSIARCALRTAPARVDARKKISFDRKQVSPLLAGELLRSILTGNRFPGGILSLLLMRVRSDQILDSIRVALIKSLIVRDMRIESRLPKRSDGTMKEDYLVRSDPDDPNPARRLGRLFAIIERAQLAALGDEINATVKDKFLSAAAATPQQVFVGVIKNAQHHIKRLRNGHSDANWIKDAAHAKRVGIGLDRDIGKLWGTFEEGVPAQHSNEEQGLFLVGYYQERYGGKAQTTGDRTPDIESEFNTDGEE